MKVATEWLEITSDAKYVAAVYSDSRDVLQTIDRGYGIRLFRLSWEFETLFGLFGWCAYACHGSEISINDEVQIGLYMGMMYFESEAKQIYGPDSKTKSSRPRASISKWCDRRERITDGKAISNCLSQCKFQDNPVDLAKIGWYSSSNTAQRVTCGFDLDRNKKMLIDFFYVFFRE